MVFSKKYQISIDTPCHQKWEGMTPMGKGRFCDSCSKNVIDFSVMSEKEIVFFFKNKPLNTCGRFTKEQVGKTYIQKPELRLSFHQRFFSFLFTLFVSNSIVDKANAQSDSVQVVQNDSLQKLVKADTTLNDTTCIVEAGNVLIDSSIARLELTIDSAWVWKYQHPTIDIQTTYIIEQGMIMGAIAWMPPPPEEPSFLEKCLASLGVLISGDSINIKPEATLSMNDNPKPTKEPLKKEPVISAAVLPEELKRKSNKNLNT